MTSREFAEEATQVTPAPERSIPAWLVITALGSLILGGFAGLIWSRLVQLPSYTVQADGSATITERSLTAFFSSDALFVNCGVVLGLGLGVAVWFLFNRLGWPVALIAGAAGLIAGVACWQVGELLGPGPFNERLAGARPSDEVPIALELHSLSALAVWAFVAVAPILLGSALGPDEEATRPSRRRRREAPADEQVDERGVLTPATQLGGSE